MNSASRSRQSSFCLNRSSQHLLSASSMVRWAPRQRDELAFDFSPASLEVVEIDLALRARRPIHLPIETCVELRCEMHAGVGQDSEVGVDTFDEGIASNVPELDDEVPRSLVLLALEPSVMPFLICDPLQRVRVVDLDCQGNPSSFQNAPRYACRILGLTLSNQRGGRQHRFVTNEKYSAENDRYTVRRKAIHRGTIS